MNGDRDGSLWRRIVSAFIAIGLLVGGVSGLAYRPPTSSPAHAIGGSVTVIGSWSGYVLDTFLAMVTPFEERTSIKVRFERTRDAADSIATGARDGRPIDVAILPSFARLFELAKAQHLVPLEDIVDRSVMRAEFGQAWLDLTTIDGLIHGLVIRAGLRGLAWFDPRSMPVGANAPRTWGDLALVTRRAAAAGILPWCMGPKAATSGADAAAWIQAFLLSEAGPDVFDHWVTHRIAWSDPAVRNAWRFLVRAPAVSSADGGGGAAWPADPAALDGCLFRHRAMLAQDGARGRTDGASLDFFPLPAPDGRSPRALLVEADILSVLRNTPQARALAAYLASVEAHEILARRGGVSPNRAVAAGVYRDPLTQRAAELLAATEVLRAGAAELMPRAVYDAFTAGAERFVHNPAALDAILDDIERIAEEAY